MYNILGNENGGGITERISVGEKRKKRSVYAYVRHEAKRLLMCDQNPLKLISANIIIGIFAAFTLYLVELCSVISEYDVLPLSSGSANTFVACLQCVIAFFGFYFVFCFIVGTYCMAACGAENKGMSLDTVLLPLRKGKNAITSLFLYLYTIFALFLCFSPLAATEIFMPVGTTKTVSVVVCAIFGIAAFCVFVFKNAAVPFVLLEGKEKNVKKAIKISSKAMKKHIFSCFVLTLSLIPLIIISILSLGILFIIYTVPLLYTSCAVFASYAYGCYRCGGKEVKNGE